MRWKTTQPPLPKQGDTKIVVRRAWLPHQIGTVVIWLGQYETLYVWNETAVIGKIGDQTATMIAGQWLKVSEKLIKWQAL